MVDAVARTDNLSMTKSQQHRRPAVTARLVAVLQTWREHWRATREGTKVVVLLLGAACLAWACYALWFSMTFDF
jgi:hypothetical protein